MADYQQRNTAPRFEVLVFHTRTGNVLAELDYSALSFDEQLNAGGTATITCPLDAATGRDTWDDRSPAYVLRGIISGPWRFSLAIVWGNTVAWAGPLVSPVPALSGVELKCSTLWALFGRRRLMTYAAVDPASLSATVSFTGRSLAGIARGIVEHATAEYGRELPLDYLPVTVDGDHERTYHGYDYKPVDEALRQLSEVIDGPDIDFRPVLVRTATGEQIRWQVRIGQPELGDPAAPLIWDQGAGLVDMSFDVDGSRMCSYVAVPGDGQENAKTFGTAYSNELVDAGWPALEDANSDHSSSTNRDELDAYAAAHLAAYKRPLVARSATIDPAVYPGLDVWRLGDWGEFHLSDNPFVDGPQRARITGSSYSDGRIKLELTGTLAEV
ncbi:hypothetical protein AB0L88_02960 [Saccharopolyspora shandongensis]|uniref:hypothetical protein n=1 Tax=Saccharopolyspora shandongensis TaxID=418495 RepID=UPI003423BF44